MDTESKLLQVIRKIGRKYSKSIHPGPLHKRKERAILEMNGVVKSAEMFGDGDAIRNWIPTIIHDYVETDIAERQQEGPQ